MSDYGSDQEDFQATQTGPATQPSQQHTQSQEPSADHWALLLNITPAPKEKAEPGKPSTTTDKVNYKLDNLKGEYRLGRWKGGDLVFKELRVSNKHCTITRMGEDANGPMAYISDPGSSNGTYVNGERLARGRKRVLEHGDEIELGATSRHSGVGATHGGVKLIYHKTESRSSESRCAVFDYYHIIGKLGSGTFAEVSKAVTLEGGEIVAIKEIQKHKFFSNPKTLQLFEREIQIMEQLSHEHICRFNSCYEDERIIYLVLEYVDGGNLLEYIMGSPGHGGLPEAQAVDLTRQICEGMAYVHRQGVTHRDLKPENVLLTSDGIAKIADFGLAKMIDNSGTYLKSMVGTPQYLAPEVVLHEVGVGYDNAVDSWSVGIIVYAMLTKLLPFTEESGDPIEVRLKKRKMETVDFSPFSQLGVSAVARDFVDRLLSKDPRTRLSLEAALTHPWIKRPTPPGVHGLAGDSFMSEESLNTTIVEGNGTTHVGTEVPAAGAFSPQSSLGNGSGAQLGFGSMAGLSASASEDYSQPFSQLALDHHSHAPPPPLASRPDSRFSSDEGSGFVGGTWAPVNGNGAMDLDGQYQNGEGSGSGLNGHDGSAPQPYTLNVPPAPVYHPPIAKPRPRPAPDAAPQPPPQPEPTPKRKRSPSPIPADTPDSINENGMAERTIRDQTLLGSPAAVSASSSLSDPPASPRPEMADPTPAQPMDSPVDSKGAIGSKVKGQSFSSPVKRSARIQNQKAPPASTTKPPPQKTPGGNSGRNVRRKTDSPVDSSVLVNGAVGDSPATASRTRTRSAATGARRKSGRLA